jgi:tripartite-type tricarboxylate transporter receptor subunit TctC
MIKRWLRVLCACLAVTPVGIVAAGAQDYPNKPIKLIVPYAPGGATDILARLLAAGLGEDLHQPVLVESRPGASGNIGTDAVAKSPPDGYTLGLFASTNLVMNPFLFPSLPFDPLKDFTAVFNVCEAPEFLFVPDTLPAKTIHELVALAKAKSGSFNYASAGIGSTPHLSADYFARLAGIQMVHVPYGGLGATIPDLTSERVQLLWGTLPALKAQVTNGKLRLLAVTAKTRVPLFPDVPTVAEAGFAPMEVMSTWFGIFAPRGTDPQTVRLLNGKLQKILEAPATQTRFADLGVIPTGGSADQFDALVKSDYVKWEPIVKASGAKFE